MTKNNNIKRKRLPARAVTAIAKRELDQAEADAINARKLSIEATQAAAEAQQVVMELLRQLKFSMRGVEVHS